MLFSTKIILRNFGTFRKLNFRHKNFLNELTLRRDPNGSVLQMLFDSKFTDPPHVVYLAGGYPNPMFFPFEKASFKMKNGNILHINKEKMDKALQYGSVQGYEPLISQLKDVIGKFHGVTDWVKNDIAMTTGGTDSLYQSLEMMLDENTLVLAESPLFGSVTQCIETYGCKYIGIPKDDFGMKPLALREEVERILKTKKNHEKMILYFNFMSVRRDDAQILHERLKNIYEIAQEFNIFIIEVDPHFFLHLHGDKKSSTSFLRLDRDERVLRCDTTSSLFGPGWRVGFVTGPKLLIQLITSHIDMSMLSACMLSQVLICETLGSFTEEDLSEYSKLLYESLRDEQRDLKSASQQYLGALDWDVYPEFPYLSFETKNPDTFLSDIQRNGGNLIFTQNLPASKQKSFYLGISLLGTTAEAKKKACSEISDIMRRTGV